MRTLFIGDIHGSTDWKWIYEKLSMFDKIIFVGDYVDSFHIMPVNIIDNLKSIINLKKSYPDKVHTLLGNHDYAYVFHKWATSGFRHEYCVEIKSIFDSNWDLFDLAWGYTSKDKLNKDGSRKYTLVTHAGMTKYFYSLIEEKFEDGNSILNKIYSSLDTPDPLHEKLNYLKDDIDLLWKVGRARGGGHMCGSIIWADKSELLSNRMEGFDQIVGHTSSYFLEINEKNDDNIYFIDKRDTYHPFYLYLNL